MAFSSGTPMQGLFGNWPASSSPEFARASVPSQQTFTGADTSTAMAHRLDQLIEEHDQEFRAKLMSLAQMAQSLGNMAQSLYKDHERGVAELRRAGRDAVASTNPSNHVPLPSHIRQTFTPGTDERNQPQSNPPSAARDAVPGNTSTALHADAIESTNLSVVEPHVEQNNRATMEHRVDQNNLAAREPQAEQPTEDPVLDENPDIDQAAARGVPASQSIDEQSRNTNAASHNEVDASANRNMQDDSPSTSLSDEEDIYEDIVHEPSTENSSTLTNTTNGQPTPDISTRSKAAKTRPSTKVQATKPPDRGWSEEQEQCLIDTIRELMQDESIQSKREMWQRAAQVMHRRGYLNVHWQNLTNRWSASLRDKCEKRGLKWAAAVMQKVPHKTRTRKRRHLSSDEESDTESELIRQSAKKREKTRPSTGSHPRTSSRADSYLTSRQGPPDVTPRNEFRLRMTWGRASSDMVEIDWSPDGSHFVAASNSVVDESEPDYESNRPANLLHGSLPTKTITALQGHYETIEYEDGTPRQLYMPVAAGARYAKSGRRLFSAGFDGRLRFWNVDGSTVTSGPEIHLKREIQVMDLADSYDNILATGVGYWKNSIRIFSAPFSLDQEPRDFSPLRTDPDLPDFRFVPTCLKFGRGRQSDWLVAGFGSPSDDYVQDRSGRVLVWKLNNAGVDAMPFRPVDDEVFDCAWSNRREVFAIGHQSDAISRTNVPEHSVVKLYSTGLLDPVATLSCQAKDINVVTTQDDMVTASCTDGSTYVWDQRQAARPVHVLTHGRPTIRLSKKDDRELKDIGVRYIEWSADSGHLYTGSSDGFLKHWDTRLAPEDALVYDVGAVGKEILCGRLSPDESDLLIGDDDGYLHLYSKSDVSFRKEKFKFVQAPAI